MALPGDFPPAPRRPPPDQLVIDPATGRMTDPWLRYFIALDRFNASVRQKLDTI